MIELLDVTTIATLALVAFVAGFIDAVAGGGGMLTVPALLSIGLPPHIALATNKLSATFASSTAALTYYNKKLFSPKFWIPAFIATLVGAIFGTLIVDHISTDFLEKALPLLIFSTAIYTLFQRKPKTENHELPKDDPNLKTKQCAQGFSLGFYDGLLGPGTGAFWTVSSMSLYKMNILLSSGLAKAMNFTSNIASLVTFILLGHVNWAIGLTMGVFLMLGAFLGAHSAIRFGANFIRPVFITVVLALTVKLAIGAWF